MKPSEIVSDVALGLSYALAVAGTACLASLGVTLIVAGVLLGAGAVAANR